MKIGQSVREFIEKVSGRKIFKIIPFGFDSIYDIQRKLSNYKFDIVFDVGANIGQTAQEFCKKLPAAKIYCFEPSADTFAQLTQNTKEKKNVQLFRLALGNESKTTKMIKSDRSDMNRVLKTEAEMIAVSENEVETITMETLSDFCAANSVDHISYLKIDTEGFDLEVLRSGVTMLAEKKVDFVEVELYGDRKSVV